MALRTEYAIAQKDHQSLDRNLIKLYRQSADNTQILIQS